MLFFRERKHSHSNVRYAEAMIARTSLVNQFHIIKIQSRLLDVHLEEAPTLAEIQQRHAAFIELFNTTAHWAHRERIDSLRTPTEVLAWVRGRRVGPDELRVVLRGLQGERTVQRNGYVRIQRFYVYAEQGLARQRVAVWLYDNHVHVTYRDALLARYVAQYDRKRKRIHALHTPMVYATPYDSPQLELWALDDTQWRKILEATPGDRRRRSTPPRLGVQAPLWEDADADAPDDGGAW